MTDMTDNERKIAGVLLEHHDELESDIDLTDYRLFADERFNGVLESQGPMTDVLSFTYTEREDGVSYLVLFVSSPDDRYQDMISLTDLSPRDEEVVMTLFAAYVKEMFGTDFAVNQE